MRQIPVAALLFSSLFLGLASAANSPKALLDAGRVDEAIDSLQNQINSSPASAESYNLLCRAYFAVGEWDQAISACEKAIRLEPNNSRYHLWLGRTYGEKADRVNFVSAAGMAKKVRGEFERAVALSPNSAEARTDLAEFYLEAPGIIGGGQDKARAQASVLEKLNPAKAHWVYGRIAEKKKDAQGAEHEYRAETDACNGCADGWLDLSYFYKRAGRLDDMEEAIETASQTHVIRADVLVDAAETLIRTGRNHPLAVELLRRYLSTGTVEEAPAFKAHYLLGSVLEKQGDKSAAVREYRNSLALARNFGRAQEALNRLQQ